MTDIAVRRIDFGYVVVPGAPDTGEAAHALPCLGYLVVHPNGVLLFDTGMGMSAAVDARYRPRRRALGGALAGAGTAVDDITHVANCHLHYDHCGGNAAFTSRPIFTQRTELAAARRTRGYTIPELVESTSVTYEEIDGDFEVLPGVLIMPTPGHTDGHQSLVVRRTDGTIIVAGQSHDTAMSYGADVLTTMVKIRPQRCPSRPPGSTDSSAWIRAGSCSPTTTPCGRSSAGLAPRRPSGASRVNGLC